VDKIAVNLEAVNVDTLNVDAFNVDAVNEPLYIAKANGRASGAAKSGAAP
jgi:hypothetical protein